jgi:membrane-bound lytic murein transglycosylase MltF
MIVVDSHKAQFWAQIFDTITVHSNLAVNTGGQIAWAFRKNSPKLREVINEFVKDHKKGTLMGNMLFRRYLRNTDYVKNALAGEEIKKFRQTVALFEKYAGMYDFDYLIIAAQAYQESGLDHSKRSRAGAIGIMQVLRSTAADPKINIPDIEKLESNIHAGVKYMRFIINNYLKEEKIDKLNKTLFAFASYNAGPTRVVNLRKEASTMGLDPDIWFGNVEVVAAKRIGRETVQYVSNIFKYYIAYRMLIEQTAMKEKARGSMQR